MSDEGRIVREKERVIGLIGLPIVGRRRSGSCRRGS